jgi:hypothetical protein
MVHMTDEELYELHQAMIRHVAGLRQLTRKGAVQYVREAAAISLPIAERALAKVRAVRSGARV